MLRYISGGKLKCNMNQRLSEHSSATTRLCVTQRLPDAVNGGGGTVRENGYRFKSPNPWGKTLSLPTLILSLCSESVSQPKWKRQWLSKTKKETAKPQQENCCVFPSPYTLSKPNIQNGFWCLSFQVNLQEVMASPISLERHWKKACRKDFRQALVVTGAAGFNSSIWNLRFKKAYGFSKCFLPLL